jgi:hypothetical protein
MRDSPKAAHPTEFEKELNGAGTDEFLGEIEDIL